MKTKNLILLAAFAMVWSTGSVSAQIIRITAYSQEGFVLGDFTKADLNSGTAGYVNYSSAGGLEAAYYTRSNIGLGLRWSGTYYGLDIETYEEDLTEMLGIAGDPYDITHTYAFWSFGSDFGVSYLANLSKRWQLEPYFYLGLRGLISPAGTVIYSQNSTTFQYLSKPRLYYGFSYSPGVKLLWNAFNHVGFYFSVEYHGASFLYDDERSMIYSYNSLEITDLEKNYHTQAVNLGLGLTFRFGKGMEQ